MTQWTMVLAAGGVSSPEAASALERLCSAYWYPTYAFVRRSGYSPADAEDLTQEFFARLLKHNWIARADRQKGRFRSFLLLALKRFLVKEWDKARTLKRGGRLRAMPLRGETAETRYSQEPADTRTPEQIFECQWALALLSAVLTQLRAAYEREGKGALFEKLEPCLIGRHEVQPYHVLAAQLSLSEAAVKMAVSRLRQRYRERLRQEVAHTVSSPEEVEEEVRHLFRVLARR